MSKFAQRGSIVLNDIVVASFSLANSVIGYVVIPRWENVGNTEVTDVKYSLSYQFSRDALPMTPPKLPTPETCRQTIMIPAAAVPTPPQQQIAPQIPQPAPPASAGPNTTVAFYAGF